MGTGTAQWLACLESRRVIASLRQFAEEVTPQAPEDIRPEPTPLSFEEAPIEFRMLVIPAMLKLVNWQALKKLTLWSYEGVRPPDEVWQWLGKQQYPALTPDGRPEGPDFQPLLACEWNLFYLTMAAASVHSSSEATTRLEKSEASGDAELVAARRQTVERALDEERKFVSLVNALFRRFRLGYTLRGGKFFRHDLRETAVLREDAMQASVDSALRSDMVSAWNSLNAMPHPNHREAVRSIRNVLEHVRDEFGRLLDPQLKSDVRKNMVSGMNKILGTASNLAAHPSGNDPTRADAIGLVNLGFALVGYLNALKQGSGVVAE